MQTTGLPVSVLTSLALHAGALGFYLHLSQMGRTRATRTIGNVDLLIQVRKPAAIPRPAEKAPTPPSTWNFLKMALPAVPKIELKRLEVKVPEASRKLLDAQPKLEEKLRKDMGPKLETLDLSQKRVEMAKIEERVESRKAAALAALPRLEEVGMRRVRNLPQALALEEKRQEAAALQTLEKLTPDLDHRRLSPAAELLKEAAPDERSALSRRIASMLPADSQRLDLRAEIRPAPESIRKKLESVVAPPLERREAEVQQERKKGVEIEGPLADRKVASFELPEFPAWAREQGILEAAVAIRFYVSPEGEVLPSLRVERTSGYGRLDRLALESLKKWKFVPLTVQERQWGIITFRFILE